MWVDQEGIIMNRKAILVFLLLTMNYTYSEASIIDLRQENSYKPLAHLALKNQQDQGEFGICYSYALASMINYFLLSHGYQNEAFWNDAGDDYKGVSPLGIAIMLKSFLENSGDLYPDLRFPQQLPNSSHDLEFGWLRYGIDMINTSHSVFPEKYFDSYIEKGPENTSGKTKIQFFADRVSYYFKQKKNKKNINYLSDFLSQYQFQENKFSGQARDLNLKELFLEPSKLQFWRKFGKSLIQGREVGVPEFKYFYLPRFHAGADRKELVIGKMSEQLGSSMAQPVGIRYCTDFLISGKNERGLQGYYSEADADQDSCSMHVSLVIGERMKRSKREFLIRDSFGTSCSQYKWECDNGNIWVDAAVLANQLNSITYLHP